MPVSGRELDEFAHPPDPDAVCRRYARTQFGLIGLDQALEAGKTHQAIYRMAARGEWTRILPRVYAVSSSGRTWRRSALAAQMWGGPASALSGETAAFILGIGRHPPNVIEVALPRGRKAPNDRLRSRRMVIESADLTTVGPFRTTNGARCLVDLASVLPGDDLERALDLVLRHRLATIARVRWTIDRLGSRGRRGVGLLAELVEQRRGSNPGAESVLEDLVLNILRRGRLPAPELQHHIDGIGRVDLYWPHANLVVECDGFEFHQDRPAFDKDRLRWNALARRGFGLIIVTHAMVVKEPDQVRDEISRALADGEPRLRLDGNAGG